MKKTLLLSAFLAVSGAMNAQWTFTPQNTNFFNASEGVTDIVALDANTAWALGYDGTSAAQVYQDFTRTTDGGTTWENGSIPLGNSVLAPTNISAVNGTTAWVGAVANGFGGGVWKTSDGGVLWTQQNATAYTSAESFFNVVHFFNENTGITQGDPVNGVFELYRTTNGGSTWTPITTAPAPALEEYGYNGGNVGVGNTFWFVTNQGKLYRTNDQGVTWTKHNTPISDFSGENTGGSIYFANSNDGILLERVGPARTPTGYILHKTNNGGTSWQAGAAFTAPYRNFAFIPGTTTLVANVSTSTATTQMTSYSNDMGTTWTVIDQGTQRTGLAFANVNHGWAGGFTDADGLGGIFKITGSLGINENNKAKVSVYPNPANDVVNIKGASINKVVAFDILGKQVVNQEFSAQNEVSVNVSSLRTGMYVLQVTNDLGATETIKFAKK